MDENSDIADFGCGPGLYTNRLAERGAVVTGIDFSENSLKYARQAAAENGFKADELYSDVAGQAFTPESLEIAVVARKS